MGGLLCPPSPTLLGPQVARHRQTWPRSYTRRPRMSTHWGDLRRVEVRRHIELTGAPPETSWPRPCTWGLSTAALTAPFDPRHSPRTSSFKQERFRAVSSWTFPNLVARAVATLCNPGPSPCPPHARGCAFPSRKGKLLTDWMGE